MTAGQEHNFEDELERLVRVDPDLDPTADDELRAAKWLLEHRTTPSTAFVAELEAHLRQYAAALGKGSRSGNGRWRSVSTWRGHGPSRWRNLWPIRLRVATAGVTLAMGVIAGIALLTPVGRATMQELGEFLGVMDMQPSAGSPFNLATSDLPVSAKELEEKIGFEVRVPEYVPEGIRVARIDRLVEPGGLSGIQIDYVAVADQSTTALSIREWQASTGLTFEMPAERVALDDTVAFLVRPSGPLEMSVLTWIDGRLVIEIASTLPETELLKVAESLR